MDDALYLAVTGFQTQVAGNKLIRALSETGFKIEFCADGESDSMGGIIETAITPTTALETDELGEIIQALQSALPDVPFSVLHKSYVVDHEDEIHIDPSGVSECDAIATVLRVVGESK